MKLFAGEVLTMFRSQCISLGTTRVMTLSKGKAHAFPMVGMSDNAKYHKPGELIQAGGVKHVERTVTVDDVAVAAVFVAEADEDMSTFELRSHYARELAYELAHMIDKNVFRTLAKAAFITDRKLAVAYFGEDGVLEDETFTNNVTLRATDSAGRPMTRGQQIVDAIYRARTEFRKKNVAGIPVCVLKPDDFEALTNAAGNIANMAWLDKRFLGMTGEDKSDGKADTGLRIAGIKIFETNNLPDKDESAGLIGSPEPLAVADGGSGRTEAYRGDFSKLIGLVYTKDAAATVKVRDIETKQVPEPLRLGTTMLAKMFVGHNILRPACSVALLAA
ncbi:capsid protein [Aeromonas allosaccharophila]|uniref:capsid protein n=1 Tax=Aeromonas allosaccharophila TaxID=656 RepID=UPI0030051436